MEVVVTGHKFESILPKDHPCHVCFKLADWFQKRRFLNNFPIGFYVKTMSADGGHFEPVSDTGSLEPLVHLSHVYMGFVLHVFSSLDKNACLRYANKFGVP
jgi:hypothetical protein